MTKVGKRPKRRLLILGTISIITIFSFFYTFGSYVYDYTNLVNEGEELNDYLSSLYSDRETLKTDIVKLQDPEYIVRYAKEKFYYTEEGEYVLKLDNNTINEEPVEIKGMSFLELSLGIVLFLLGILIIKKGLKKTAK